MAQLESFASIYHRASDRKGGDTGLEALLPDASCKCAVIEYSDAKLLSAMSKKVFQSGFVWRVVENKWSAYESSFFNFAPAKVLMLSPEQLHQRASDITLIRHMKKTMAIYANAMMIQHAADEHGSFAAFISSWPVDDITGLWSWLKKHGCRLGGNTGPYFLRAIGKDTFLLTADVQGYFISHQLIDSGFSAKSGLRQVQGVFNTWQQQSGRSLADISRILAYSVGENRI